MSRALVLARHGMGRRWAALLAVGVVLAVGAGVGLASLELAERTDRAYARYREDADVAQLVINPSVSTAETADLLRSIDGVESVTSDALLTAGPDLRALGGALEDVSDFLQVRVSSDGRYVTQDRPAVRKGRMIRDGAEVFISEGAAESLDLDVGDEVPLLFFWSGTDFSGDLDAIAANPLGTVDVTVVGIGSFPDEVLPDDLIPREKLLVTPDVGARFDCLLPPPDASDLRSIDELFAYFLPQDCSTSYHFFSMRTTGGDAGALEVGERVAAAFEAANAELPAAMRENDLGYFFIPSFAADEAKRLEESLSPVVTSLRAFAVVALVVTVALAVILVVRQVRRRATEVEVWRSLGATRGDRVLALVGPALLAAVVGVALAVVAAWVASGSGAIGSASAVDVHAGRSVAGSVLLVAAAMLLASTAALVLAAIASMPSGTLTMSSGRAGSARSSRPALTLGLRAARRGGGAAAVLAGSTLAVLTVAATLVFTASLLRFLDEPRGFGWPYDVAALVNAGYDNPDVEAISATLDDPGAGVAAWGRAALSLGTQVNGATVPVVGMREGFEAVARTPVVSGRLPSGSDEVALGRLTADELDVAIGDEVEVASQYGERRGTVTGFVVLPAIGALESDRASLGTGLLLPPAFMDEMAAAAAGDLDLSGEEIADSLGSFVVIDLEPGVEPAGWLREHAAAMVAWDPFDVAPLAYTEPVRPPVVIDVEAMQRVPALLDGVLALAMGAGVVAGVASGTHARRRELAVLRALGGSAREVRSSVRWHALAVVGTGLVVGLPLGVALGRTAYSEFARSIGAAPDPIHPFALLALLTVAVVVLGLAAAVVPGRRATARATVAQVLQHDAASPAG